MEVLREVEGGNAGGEGGQGELLVDLGEIPSLVRRRHDLQADDRDHKNPDIELPLTVDNSISNAMTACMSASAWVPLAPSRTAMLVRISW